jgi:hypothetical protein
MMRFYCYAADACLAIADPGLNPKGRVVFILDMGDFGVKNFDLLGAKSIVTMIRVRGGLNGAC